jgi:hypothetical protein
MPTTAPAAKLGWFSLGYRDNLAWFGRVGERRLHNILISDILQMRFGEGKMALLSPMLRRGGVAGNTCLENSELGGWREDHQPPPHHRAGPRPDRTPFMTAYTGANEQVPRLSAQVPFTQ